MMSTSSNNGSPEQLEFELRSKAAAQALYRSITEFHTFFRRETVSRVVKNAGYCKSLLGNIKGQDPDRFYFDVTRTHREVVDHVWSILHPDSDTRPEHSPTSPSPTEDRPNDTGLPPPLPIRGMHRRHSARESGRSRPQTSPFHNRHMPPLPPYSQRSLSTEVVTGGRSNLPPHMHSLSSFNPYLSPSISETESESSVDEQYATGGSDSYISFMNRADPAYLPSSRSDPGTTSVTSDAYITSEDSECSAASLDHQRINSPPPVYSEIDPEHETRLTFTDTPSSGISLVSPVITVPGNGTIFNFDAASVLARTRDLEGELQRLRSAMTCRLCKQNPIGATFCPCGHTVCCFPCAQRLKTCWECDETVHSVQRMLLAR